MEVLYCSDIQVTQQKRLSAFFEKYYSQEIENECHKTQRFTEESPHFIDKKLISLSYDIKQNLSFYDTYMTKASLSWRNSEDRDVLFGSKPQDLLSLKSDTEEHNKWSARSSKLLSGSQEPFTNGIKLLKPAGMQTAVLFERNPVNNSSKDEMAIVIHTSDSFCDVTNTSKSSSFSKSSFFESYKGTLEELVQSEVPSQFQDYFQTVSTNINKHSSLINDQTGRNQLKLSKTIEYSSPKINNLEKGASHDKRHKIRFWLNDKETSGDTTIFMLSHSIEIEKH